MSIERHSCDDPRLLIDVRTLDRNARLDSPGKHCATQSAPISLSLLGTASNVTGKLERAEPASIDQR